MTAPYMTPSPATAAAIDWIRRKAQQPHMALFTMSQEDAQRVVAHIDRLDRLVAAQERAIWSAEPVEPPCWGQDPRSLPSGLLARLWRRRRHA